MPDGRLCTLCIVESYFEDEQASMDSIVKNIVFKGEDPVTKVTL